MKKNVLLFIAFIFLASVSIIGQTLKKRISKPIVANTTIQTPSFRNTTISVGIPQVFTSEAAFRATIGSDYAVDEYAGFTPGTTVDTLQRMSGLYAYIMFADSSLFFTYEGVSTNMDNDSLVLINAGKPVSAFGGYFYTTNYYNIFQTTPIRIKVSDYTYTFTPSDSLSFIGFVFPATNISYFTVAKATIVSNLWVSMDHLIWSDGSLASTVCDAKKTNTFYPNPTTDGIYVNAEGTLSVYNTAGQLVVSQAVTEGSYVSLGALPKGQYIVKIESVSGVLEEKLIKK